MSSMMLGLPRCIIYDVGKDVVDGSKCSANASIKMGNFDDLIERRRCETAGWLNKTLCCDDQRIIVTTRCHSSPRLLGMNH
jgi:hypothetical protein